jgi:hypothetical protein
MPTTILATRFNNLQDRLDAVLGTSVSAAPTFGYGQTLNAALDVAGTRSNTIPNSDKVSAQQYEDLYIDIVRCRAHQVGAAAVTIDDFVIGDFETNAANTDKVEEAYISALESLMTTIESDRFDIDITTQASTTTLTTSANTPISSTYYTSVSGSWTSFLNQIFTVTFPTVEDRRHFFNAGGEIRFNAQVAYTGAQQKTADWQSSMAAMGVVSFTADDTYSNSSVGSASNIGNNSLTSTYQLCYRKDAGTTYSQSAYELYALQTGPRTIQFKVFFTDPAPGGWSIDEPLYGDWTSSASLLVPDGTVTINGLSHNTVVIEAAQLPSGSNIVILSANAPPVPSYSLSRSSASASEGSSASFTLTTTNVSNGTTIPYTITGVSTSDINVPLQGSFVVGVSTTLTITFASDLLTEGTETLTLSLNNGQSSIGVSINDTSLSPPAQGTPLGQYCDGVNLREYRADGAGGSTSVLIEANSPTCGYVPPFTFSVAPTDYLVQNTAWDIGDTVINTTATTNITITGTSGSGTVTVQETSRPSDWNVAVDDVSSLTLYNTPVSKNYSITDGQEISVPLGVTPTSVLDFKSQNRQFDFTILEATGAGSSYKVYWTGAGVAPPAAPNINFTLNVTPVEGNETTSNTFTFSGTVTGWLAGTDGTGDISWQNESGTATAADFVGNATSGTAPVTITNSPSTGDGTFSFTRSIRTDLLTEGDETFGTYAYLPAPSAARSQTRMATIIDNPPPPVSAQFADATHTFSIAPRETTTWSTSVSLSSAPTNDPVELTVMIASWYTTWEVSINGSAVAVAGGGARHTFTIAPNESETITISVTATDGPHDASTGQLYLYQGSGTSGSPILHRHYYTGTTTAWAAPSVLTAGFSPPSPVVGTPATLYYTTSNATRVVYSIIGAGVNEQVTYNNELIPNGPNVIANTVSVTFPVEGTATWTVTAFTPDGQEDSASGQLTTTLIEPNYQITITSGYSPLEGDTITFQLRYKNVIRGASYRIFKGSGVNAAADYGLSSHRFDFFGLNTAQDNVWRTTTRTLTSVNDGIIEGTESHYLSDADGVLHYVDWTLSDQPIINTFLITPSSVPVRGLFTFVSTGTPNTTVTYTAASVPDYNQVGGTYTLNSSGSYTRSSLHTLPGDFTYVGTFPVGSPSTATATVRICPVLSISMPSSALSGDTVTVTISGGLRNGTFTWGQNGVMGPLPLISFNGSGVASVVFTAGSPATYTFTAQETFCYGTATASITVSQIYSPSTVMTPTSPTVGGDATLSISGGRPNGSFSITGLHPVADVFDASGGYSITSQYSVAGTYNYVLVVPTPDNDYPFTVVVGPAPILKQPEFYLFQPTRDSQVSGLITKGLPNGTYARSSTNNAAGSAASSGTLDGAGNGSFSYTRNNNDLSTYTSVSFATPGSYATGYNPLSDTLAPIAAPVQVPVPTIIWSPSSAILNTTSVTLSWNAGAGATSASIVVVNPLSEITTLTGLTGSETAPLGVVGIWSADITASNSAGNGEADDTIVVTAANPVPTPTIEFITATYTVGQAIQAAVNPDSASGTYSSYSYIRGPNNVVIASSVSTSSHTISGTATATGLYTAGVLVTYLGNSNQPLTATATDTTLVYAAPAAGTVLSSNCTSPFTLVQQIANGSGGSTTVETPNSPTCGYVAPPATPVINYFYWSPASIQVGESNTLYWSVTGATSVVVSGDTGTYSLGLSGTRANGPYNGAGDFSTTLTAYKAGASPTTATATAPITVTAPAAPAAPSISFGPSVGIINVTSYTLTWTANGVSPASIIIQSPGVPPSAFTDLTGNYTSTLGVIGIYTATITTAGGTSSVSVTVNNAPEAPPAVGTLLSTYCVGTTLWGVYSGGYSPSTYAIITTNSPSCGYVPPPPAAGTVLGSSCSGTTLVQQIANGSGGQTTTYTVNSTDCGYEPPASYPVTISVDVGLYNGATSTVTATLTGTPNAAYAWTLTGGAEGTGVFNSAGQAILSAALSAGIYLGTVTSGGESASTTWRVGYGRIR